MTLRELQEKQPWDLGYSSPFENDERPHKDFEHALIHVVKSLGKLATLIEHEDHERRFDVHAETKPGSRIYEGGIAGAFPKSRLGAGDWLADLVICALRMANTYPGEKIDLEAAVIARIGEKNPSWQTPKTTPREPTPVSAR